VEQRKRLYILDALRGFLLINMIAHHTLWDLFNLYDVNLPWFRGTVSTVWQQWGCTSFIMLSGFCMTFGRKKLRRALFILLCSVAVTLVTMVFMPSRPANFGILTLLGTCALISIPLEKPLSKVNPYVGLAIFLSLFLVTYGFRKGYVGIYFYELSDMPEFLYKNYFTAFFGFPHDDFRSSDYFPLLPWVFAYFSGHFIFRIFKKHNKLEVFSAFRVRPFEFLGRHSLIIYLVHQPIIYGTLFLLAHFSLI